VNLSLLHRTYVLLQPPDFNPAQHNYVLDERFCSGKIDAAGLEVTFSQDDTAAHGGGNGGDTGQVSGGVGGASEANNPNDDATDDSIATYGGGMGGEGGEGSNGEGKGGGRGGTRVLGKKEQEKAAVARLGVTTKTRKTGMAERSQRRRGRRQKLANLGIRVRSTN